MAETKPKALTSQTYTTPSGRASAAAEQMAKAKKDGGARAAYSRMLVEQSKSFGDYVSARIGSTFKKAG